jgi:hypothetical protein
VRLPLKYGSPTFTIFYRAIYSVLGQNILRKPRLNDAGFVTLQSSERSPFACKGIPMRPHILDDTQHWRDRAAASRALADQMSDAMAKELMLLVASNYDPIAEHASERAEMQATPIRR